MQDSNRKLLICVTRAKWPSDTYKKRWDGHFWAPGFGQMKVKVHIQGESFAITAIFSKASRLVFSGTHLEPSLQYWNVCYLCQCIIEETWTVLLMTEPQTAYSRKSWPSRRVPIKRYYAVTCHKLHSDGALQFMRSQSQMVSLKTTVEWKLVDFIWEFSL